MKNTRTPTPRNAWHIGAGSVAVLLLSGCASLGPGARPAVYDFGPGPMVSASAPGNAAAPTLLLEVIDANPALDSSAMLYRLAYADSQQLQPYALARWSMTPSQLLGQRLREQLGQHYTLLKAGDSSAGALNLRIELEEFSQLFTAPASSVGLLRLRATALQANAAEPQRWVQRSIVVQRSAPSADAVGGVRALTQATDAALQELGRWLTDRAQP